MRWFGTLVRIVGWLLTPLVAWAVSLGAAWVLLGFSGRFDNPRHALYAALAAAFIAGVLILFGWMLLLRRSPRLRHSLHVTPEGLPDIELEEPAEPADATGVTTAEPPQ